MRKHELGSRHRWVLHLVLVALLLAAFAVLAVFQYRWIGEATEAERQRMQNSVQLAMTRFAEEFNGEASRALMALLPGSRSLEGGPYGELFLQWTATTAYPRIVRNVFIVENEGQGQLRLLHFDMDSRSLEPMDWPDHLRDVQEGLATPSSDIRSEQRRRPRHSGLFLGRDPPTAIAPIPVAGARLGRTASFFSPDVIFPKALIRSLPSEPQDWVIVEFDQDFIVKYVFPSLHDRYFAALGEDEYRVGVMTTNEPRTIVYRSDTSISSQNFATADARTGLFEFRASGHAFSGEPPPAARGGRTARSAFSSPSPPGHWQLFVEHRLGSLDAAVGQIHRRNLEVSFGMLLVLVAGVVMIIVASERARILARLQMEFAAAVSHELRTPLTVIQALSHNLTSGIVKNPSHVREYAGMVQSEARGLTSMVDQVLLFAETRTNRKAYDLSPVEVVEVVDRALGVLESQIRDSGCQIAVDIPDDLPAVRANTTSLVHCVRNLVSNALKYGRADSGYSVIHVGAAVAAATREIEISVADNGPGIHPADWPHLFQAFYRGRSARPGTRGAGLGLYLVKHMIEAQGGRITVETRHQPGSKFILHVPVAGPEFVWEPAIVPDRG
jgi:signal transduction histidine kinase